MSESHHESRQKQKYIQCLASKREWDAAQDNLHERKVLVTVVRLEQRSSTVELDKHTTDAPDVTGRAPSKTYQSKYEHWNKKRRYCLTKDDLGCSVVAGGDHVAEGLVRVRCRAEVDKNNVQTLQFVLRLSVVLRGDVISGTVMLTFEPV